VIKVSAPAVATKMNRRTVVRMKSISTGNILRSLV
jgi:hypothetical protein